MQQRGAIDKRNATDFGLLRTDLGLAYKHEQGERDGDLNILHSELLTREITSGSEFIHARMLLTLEWSRESDGLARSLWPRKLRPSVSLRAHALGTD